MSLITGLINGTLAIDSSAPAIQFDKHWYSWGEFRRTIDAVDACLQNAGLKADTRVGVMVRNRPDSLAAIIGVIGRDSCLVSINPLLPKDRLLADLIALALPVVIGESDDLAREGVLDVLRVAGTAVIELEPILQGAHSLKGMEAPTGTALKVLEPGVVIQMLTSGTTGTPKRVPLKRTAFESSFISALSYEKDRKADDAPVLRDETVILSNPFTHIGGLWGALTCIAGGRRACLMEKFSVQSWRDAIVEHRPKVAGAVPTALRMILDANIPKEDLESLVAIRTGAAPLAPSITAEFLERYQIPVLQNYGATEFSGSVAGWTLRDFYKYQAHKPGSVGRFQPGVTGRVVDQDTGLEKPHGEEGVLEMQSGQFGNGGGWVRTTDRAIIDADGFLFIKGRADSAIIRGGFKVHPDDVAATLEKHPAIREAVVVGIEDRRLGAVPVAAIMLKANVPTPSDEELIAFAKSHLLPYQVPVRFMVVDDVPRTPSMKPMLPQVRELFGDAA